MMWELLTTAVPALALSVQQINPNPCVIGGLSCGDPFAIVANIITGSWLYSIFGVVLFFMIIVYGVTLIINSRSDSAQADAVKSYVNAFIGTVLAASSSYIAGLVIDGGAARNPDLINWAEFLPFSAVVLGNVYDFLKAIVIGLLILNLFIQGMRLILSTDDSAASEAYKGLVRGIVGTIIVLVAVPIINAVVPGGDATVITTITDIATFLVGVLGGLAAIGLVIAGIMYIVSIDEGLKDRANKLIITCIVTLIVVAATYALLSSI